MREQNIAHESEYLCRYVTKQCKFLQATFKNCMYTFNILNIHNMYQNYMCRI